MRAMCAVTMVLMAACGGSGEQAEPVDSTAATPTVEAPVVPAVEDENRYVVEMIMYRTQFI